MQESVSANGARWNGFVGSAGCGAILLLLVASGASAFDYDEHKYLSNVGFRIAVATSPSATLPKDELLKFMEKDAIHERKSFGDLVGLADYVRGVEPLFEHRGVFDSTDEIDWQHVINLKRDWLRFLQAAHINEAHFQVAALLTHRNEHEAAISASRERRLTRAIVLEGYGLHFLEDFHAPGHLATTRPALPDYVAIATHEKFNAAGLPFTLRDPEGRLAELVDYTINHFAELDLPSLAHDEIEADGRFGVDDFKALRTALNGGPQTFLGDSLLLRQKPKVQAAYLAILAARSVRDVLDAYGNPGNPDGKAYASSFVPFCWYCGKIVGQQVCNGSKVPTGKTLIKLAATPFGVYDTSRRNFVLFGFKPGDVLLLSYYGEFSNSRGLEGRAGQFEISAESLLMALGSPRLLGEVAGVSSGPKLYEPTGWFATSFLYGASYTLGDNDSKGLHLRYLLAIPRIDIQFSFSYGIRWYELGRGASVKAYPIGYGVETGFGFFLLHFGVNKEYSQVPLTRKLKSRNLFRTGVTLMLPKSVYRVPFQALGRKLGRLRHD